MVKDKQGESVFEYAARYSSPSFKTELDRKIIQHTVSRKLESMPLKGTAILPLLLEELCYYHFKLLRSAYIVSYCTFLVY